MINFLKNRLHPVTYTLNRKCEHKNGWHDKVNFWIFSKKVFVCTDCITITESREDK